MYTDYLRVFTLNFSFSYDELALKKKAFSFSSEVHFWKGVETPGVEKPGKERNQTKIRKKPPDWSFKMEKKLIFFSLPAPQNKRLYQYKALRVSAYF